MIITIIHWAFTFLICLLTGNLVLHFLYSLFDAAVLKPADIRSCFKRKIPNAAIMSCLIAGMASLTVYAQFFSLFSGVGILALIPVAAVCGSSAFFFSEEVKTFFNTIKRTALSWQGLIYVMIILAVAFYSSRGIEHHDTGLYHAQAIRWIEEYGVVPGLGNLFGNYAYNSAYFAFVALFSLKPVLGVSLHTSTGFLAVCMCIYAFERLRGFRRHIDHIPDFIMSAAIFYTIIFAAYLSSPASDAPVAYLIIYFLSRFAEVFGRERTLYEECLLSIGLVWVVSIKFSAALIVLMALVPAAELLRGKRIRVILVSILAGALVICPFLIRNYLISGYLIYPFPSLDIFGAAWKMPLEYVRDDANLISIYGKFLYKIEESEIPQSLFGWVPVWWKFSERYEQKLAGSVLASFTGIFAILGQKLIGRKKINYKMCMLHLACIANIGFWFVSAPFIRYGLGFLLAYPMIFLGEAWDSRQSMNLLKIICGGCIFLCLWLQTPYLDHYMMDDLVLAARYVRGEKYIVWPKDYEKYDLESYEINGITFYYSPDGEKTGYYGFPGSPKKRTGRMLPGGESLKNGFLPE